MNTRNLAREVQKLVDADADAYSPGPALVDWFQRAKDKDLWRVNVFGAAAAISADRGRLLATFIRLVQAGILGLNWDYHCTECNAVPGRTVTSARQPPGTTARCATSIFGTRSTRTWRSRSRPTRVSTRSIGSSSRSRRG